MSEFAARNQVAIAGYAQSPVSRRSPMSLGALTIQTTREAIADAGLAVSDIDGFTTTPMFPSFGSHSAEDGVAFVTANWLAQHLGVIPRFMENPQGQLPAPVALAVNAIHAGAADYVVVHRALHNPVGRYHNSTEQEARGREQWGMPQGHFGPIAAIALAYNEYVQRYDVPENALASVVTEARKNGARLPWSYWADKPLSEEAYLAAPVINDPIRMFDCDIPVDAVATFVLTSAERARDLPHKPVYISSYTEMLPKRRLIPSLWPYDGIMEQGQQNVDQLCQRAGVSVEEIDYLQVYDGFAPLVYFWMELTGLCGPGEAHQMVSEGGIDSDRAGSPAVLASGGSLGNGRVHGTAQMLECYLQLSRRAGERQRDVNMAMACQGLPNSGGAVVYSSEKY